MKMTEEHDLEVRQSPNAVDELKREQSVYFNLSLPRGRVLYMSSSTSQTSLFTTCALSAPIIKKAPHVISSHITAPVCPTRRVSSLLPYRRLYIRM